MLGMFYLSIDAGMFALNDLFQCFCNAISMLEIVTVLYFGNYWRPANSEMCAVAKFQNQLRGQRAV
jgi:hypothetical protein